MAKSTKAKALLVSLDSLDEWPKESAPKGCQTIYVTRQSAEELEVSFPDGEFSSATLITLPPVDMTRMGQVKMAVVLAVSNELINMGDSIVFVTGLPGMAQLDAVLFLDTGRESEIFTVQGLQSISGGVKPEVFQEALTIALELAANGREGRTMGTIFVLGDEEKVLQLSKQMIINPFKGYSDKERNILHGNLRETLREFSALDGAFVISGDGLILTAGRYLGAASDESENLRGLGSRHVAAAGITAMTQAVAIVISESTGDVRIFKDGRVLMEIEKPFKQPVA